MILGELQSHGGTVGSMGDRGSGQFGAADLASYKIWREFNAETNLVQSGCRDQLGANLTQRPTIPTTHRLHTSLSALPRRHHECQRYGVSYLLHIPSPQFAQDSVDGYTGADLS